MGTKNYFQYFYGILQEHWLTSILTIVLYEKFNTSFVLNTSYDCQPSIYDKFYQLYFMIWSLSIFVVTRGQRYMAVDLTIQWIYLIFLWRVVQMWKGKNVLGNYNKTLRTNLRDVSVDFTSSEMGEGLSGRV